MCFSYLYVGKSLKRNIRTLLHWVDFFTPLLISRGRWCNWFWNIIPSIYKLTIHFDEIHLGSSRQNRLNVIEYCNISYFQIPDDNKNITNMIYNNCNACVIPKNVAVITRIYFGRYKVHSFSLTIYFSSHKTTIAIPVNKVNIYKI